MQLNPEMFNVLLEDERVRVIDDRVREQMKGILTDIQSGEFAREWVEDMDNNEARLKEMRAEAAQSQLETVGKELRGLMHKAGER